MKLYIVSLLKGIFLMICKFKMNFIVKSQFLKCTELEKQKWLKNSYVHNKSSLCILCICSMICQTTGSQPLLSLPDTNPNFLKVFITDLSPTVSVNLLYMDLRGYTMNDERLFINKYLVTVLLRVYNILSKSRHEVR